MNGVAQVGDMSAIVTLDYHGNVQYFSQTIGAGGWNKNPVSYESKFTSAPSVAQVGDSAVIIAVDNTGSLWSYWQAIGTRPWNPDPVFLTEPEAPFSTLPYPSVAQVGNSSVITASDDRGNLWYFWQAISTEGWNPEQVASYQSLGG